ncbi:MAG: hypothetical protein QM401_06310 [Bacillota bacterium]|nr:hypothetical protein [Bacillota bacterium]HHU60433.1 hypothetical protein [Natronincola sp.]
MKKIKEITKASSIWKAIPMVWRAGLQSFKDNITVKELEAKIKHNEEAFLELSRLVHDYETKIHNAVREAQDFKRQNEEYERAYRALRIENKWLKEEIFKLKK